VREFSDRKSCHRTVAENYPGDDFEGSKSPEYTCSWISEPTLARSALKRKAKMISAESRWTTQAAPRAHHESSYQPTVVGIA
jgi:hypothetical protein